MYNSGSISTLSPKTSEIPMTKVFLISNVVVRMICIPAITMKIVTKTRIAPITGFGMMEKRAESLGKKARMIKRHPALIPIRRLVAPVATDTPTLLEEVDIPNPPSMPDNMHPIPSASKPPLMLFMSACVQASSLTFWAVIKSPMLFKLEAKEAIRKGTNEDRSKDQLMWLLSGKAINDECHTCAMSALLRIPRGYESK